MLDLTLPSSVVDREYLMTWNMRRKFYHSLAIACTFEANVYSVGCKLVENNSWPSAPVNTLIIGLKELPLADSPLPHTHIQFAHCYKGQAGWSSILSRFHRGHGTLYDLEFLTDPQGRRVAAFGFHAGFAGAAVGALALSSIKKGEKLGALQPFVSEEAMINAVKMSLGGSGKGVKTLVMGALGRCGRGAVDLFRKIGLAECVIHSIITSRHPCDGFGFQRRHLEVGLGRDR